MTQKRFVNQLTFNYTAILSLYFMGFAAIFAFAAVFLRAKGFTSQQIGLTLALGNLATLFVQPVVADWVDRSKRLTLNQIALIMAVILLTAEILLAILPNLFLAILISFLITQMLMATLQTLLVSLSLQQINRGVPVNFGLARGLGSGAFAIISINLGGAIENFGAKMVPLVAIATTTLMIVFIQLFKANAAKVNEEGAWHLPSGARHLADSDPNQPKSFTQFYKRYPQFFVLLFGITLILVNHSIYWSYQINIAEHVGGSSRTLGQAAALAAGLEIPVMAYFAVFARKIPIRSLLTISSLFFVLKSAATLLATTVPQFLASQFLQIGAFALYLPAIIFYVNEMMDDRDTIKGQAYIAMASTIGSIIGNLLGGLLLDISTVSITLMVALGFSIIGAALVNIGIRPRRNYD